MLKDEFILTNSLYSLKGIDSTQPAGVGKVCTLAKLKTSMMKHFQSIGWLLNALLARQFDASDKISEGGTMEGEDTVSTRTTLCACAACVTTRKQSAERRTNVRAAMLTKRCLPRSFGSR